MRGRMPALSPISTFLPHSSCSHNPRPAPPARSATTHSHGCVHGERIRRPGCGQRGVATCAASHAAASSDIRGTPYLESPRVLQELGRLLHALTKAHSIKDLCRVDCSSFASGPRRGQESAGAAEGRAVHPPLAARRQQPACWILGTGLHSFLVLHLHTVLDKSQRIGAQRCAKGAGVCLRGWGWVGVGVCVGGGGGGGAGG